MAAPPKGEASWNDDQLAADVATISYEQALRTHARACPTRTDADADAPGVSGPQRDGTPHARSLKTASITIRLSETECAQLRQRAAEVGLTVSAYLRSCTLEVESLRSQVKETLAELRNSRPQAAIQDSGTEPNGSCTSVLHRLWDWFRLIGLRRRPAVRLNPANPFAPARS